MLNLPFHIPDDVCELLITERSAFLSEQEANDPRFHRLLDEFHRSVRTHW